MKRFFVFLGISLIVVAGILLTDRVHAARSPLVLAFYYNWFDENTWNPSRVPDLPAERYVSRDAGAMARHIQQARGAGIDAFVVSWWGAGNPTDENFKVMLNQARGTNFQVAVDFELTSPFYRSKDDVIHSLRNLLSTHAQQPAYLKVDGKPVIFFWREQKYSVSEWRAIRDAVDPNRQSWWIAEGVKEQLPYLNVFDGFHLYSIAWAQDVAAELTKWPPRVRTYGADKIWVATVMPGNDDTRTNRAGSYVRARRGGDFYREAWRGAFAAYPDWIIITSWNEWVEGTMIEPSITYGNLYLDITREYAAKFKAGLPAPTATFTPTPKPMATKTLTPTATATITATLISGGLRGVVTDTLRVRAEPNISATILGRLPEGTNVTILAQNEDASWWQIAYPSAKQRGWISAEFVRLETLTDTLSLAEVATATPTPTREATPTLWVETATPEPTAVPPTETPTPTQTPTLTPTPSGLFPSIKSLFPFLP